MDVVLSALRPEAPIFIPQTGGMDSVETEVSSDVAIQQCREERDKAMLEVSHAAISNTIAEVESKYTAHVKRIEGQTQRLWDIVRQSESTLDEDTEKTVAVRESLSEIIRSQMEEIEGMQEGFATVFADMEKMVSG